jgi:diguanylate cyclase (GGDEF)-like protein
MVLSYDFDSQLRDLETIISDYTGWFLEATRRIFYPADNNDMRDQLLECPSSFGAWVAGAVQNGSIKTDLLQNLNHLHRDLCGLADALIDNGARTKLPPPFKDYHTLAVLFEEFTGHIRRLEKDCLLEDSGIDALTGLRSKEVMEKDIRREMDRLARQGKSFALALVRIDNFEKLKAEMTMEEADQCVKTVAEMVKKCMRSFDDAYHVNGMFVLSLKQTGASGGIRALKRLKEDLAQSSAQYTVRGKPQPLSLSSCVGEPNEKDDVMTFIENLKKDLSHHQGDKGGSIVEYFELSPLQRYIRDNGHGRV